MNIALPFVRLRDEEIRHMPSNLILITNGVATKHLLETATLVSHLSQIQPSINTYVLAFTSARSQFCLLIIEIISGAALPSSFNLPT